MKKKVFLLANTVYQLVVAVQMKLTVLKDMDVDLFISDHSQGVEKYVETGKNAKLFREITYIKTKEYSYREGKYSKIDNLQEMKLVMKRYSDVKKKCGTLEKYDYLFSANIDFFTISLFDYLFFLNKRCKFFLFEDGCSTYGVQEKIIYEHQLSIEEGHIGKLRSFFNYGKIFENFVGVFLINPSLLEWKRRVKRYRIPKIEKNNIKHRNVYNTFFGYDEKVMKYDYKVLFFEESFWGDGYKCNDEMLIQKIANIVGKENMLIKLHPRNPGNRFADYKVYEEQGMPWEIIYMNSDMRGKILISISSSCIINPFLLFNEKQKVITLIKLAHIFGDNGNEYRLFLKKNFFDKKPDYFIQPSSIKELKECLACLEMQ